MDNPKENPKHWDRRTLERNIRKGVFARKDLDKHVKALPDAADKSQPLSLTDRDDSDDGGDGET